MLACAAIEKALGALRVRVMSSVYAKATLGANCRSIAEVGFLIAGIRDRAWHCDDSAIDPLVASLGS
jgi:hypothetical protein